MFKQHKFETEIQGVPQIFLSPEAANDMWIIVDEVPTEVGWLGSAYRRGNDIFIKKIYLMKQQVHAATTELTPEGIAATGMEILSQPNGMEEANALKFWGHSHVNMGTTPSGQDEDQMKLFKDAGLDWAVRGIFNKKKKAQFDIFFFQLGWTVRDAEWEVAVAPGDTGRERWKNEIKDKVAPLISTWQNGYDYGRPNPVSQVESHPITATCSLCKERIKLSYALTNCKVTCPYCKVAMLPTNLTYPGRQNWIHGPGHTPSANLGFDKGFDKDYPKNPPVGDRIGAHSGELADDEYFYRKPRNPVGKDERDMVSGASNSLDTPSPSLDEVLNRHNERLRKQHGGKHRVPEVPATTPEVTPTGVQPEKPAAGSADPYDVNGWLE